MQVELVLVRLGMVQHLHVAALHAHGEPLPGGTVAQREDLEPSEKRLTSGCINEQSRPLLSSPER